MLQQFYYEAENPKNTFTFLQKCHQKDIKEINKNNINTDKEIKSNIAKIMADYFITL